MDVRAAIAVAAAKPLEIVSVQLEGLREGDAFELMKRGESIRGVVRF